MQRVARIEQTYALRPVKVGEPFEVEPQDVEILLKLGRIEPEDGEVGYVISEIGPVPECGGVSAEVPLVKSKQAPKDKKYNGQRKAA